MLTFGNCGLTNAHISINNILHLNVHPSITSKTYSIYDLSGKKVLSSKAISETMEINTSGLANGMYFLNVKAEEGEITLRFVKK